MAHRRPRAQPVLHAAQLLKQVLQRRHRVVELVSLLSVLRLSNIVASFSMNDTRICAIAGLANKPRESERASERPRTTCRHREAERRRDGEPEPRSARAICDAARCFATTPQPSAQPHHTPTPRSRAVLPSPPRPPPSPGSRARDGPPAVPAGCCPYALRLHSTAPRGTAALAAAGCSRAASPRAAPPRPRRNGRVRDSAVGHGRSDTLRRQPRLREGGKLHELHDEYQVTTTPRQYDSIDDAWIAVRCRS